LATGKLTARSFGVPADDWHVLQTARPNVLLIGSDAAVTGFLELLRPIVQPPVIESATGDLTLPSHASGTFILRDLSRLDAAGQQRLSAWLSESARTTQVISTSTVPLFPLVERDELSAPLYYSLNVIMLILRDPSSSR